MYSCDRPVDVWLSFGLAFVGGYGDAAGFVLAKTFTGHVTGNLVLGAIAIAAGDWRALIRLSLAIVTFLLGVFLSVLIIRLANAWPAWPPLSTVMCLEVILIVAASITLAAHMTLGTEIFVLCLSLALGLQNGAFRQTGGVSVHTTYLTGLITGLITSATDKYVSKASQPPATLPDPKADLRARIWIAFVLGACTGATMVFRFKTLGILGMALVLFATIVGNSIVGSPARPNSSLVSH
jgi:uncharacterized membrane protein YoaK (UPF0700 family)